MLRLVKEVAPIVFEGAGPNCMSGSCPEGKMSCGRAIEVREKYAAL
jgi:thymidylate synthase (FAD)